MRRRAYPLSSALLALLLLSGRATTGHAPNTTTPIAILDDIVWIGALFSVTSVSSFGFAAGAMISSGDLRAFAVAVTLALIGVSGLAITRLGFRLAAFSRSVAAVASHGYPVANDH